MSTIQDMFQQAQLSEAAYANFGGFPNPKDALIDQELKGQHHNTF